MRRIYLDYAATTPLDSEVVKAMKPFLKKGTSGIFGNASSLHTRGQEASRAIDNARVVIAKACAAQQGEVIFAGSATEANNLMIRGALKAYFRNQDSCGRVPKIIVSSVEHPSILKTVEDLEKDGSAVIERVSVDKNGVVDVGALERALDQDTILVSVQWVNNEVGAIQPIEKIGNTIRTYKSTHSQDIYPLFHSDASQAAGLFDCNMTRAGLDAMTLSSHKIYGPKGVGALLFSQEAQRKNALVPLVTGGSQEGGFRAGTLNTAGIVGFGRAMERCVENREHDGVHLRMLQERLRKGLGILKEVEYYVEEELSSPHICAMFIPSLSQPVVACDIAGIEVSSGSACKQRKIEPSHTLVAMGYEMDRVTRSMRVSMGRMTTKKEIDEAIKRIILVVRSRIS